MQIYYENLHTLEDSVRFEMMPCAMLETNLILP